MTVVEDSSYGGSGRAPHDTLREELTTTDYIRVDDSVTFVDLAAIEGAIRRSGQEASRVVVCVDEDRGSVSASTPHIEVKGNRSCAVASRFRDAGSDPEPFTGTVTVRWHERQLWPRLWLPMIPTVGVPLAALVLGLTSLRRTNRHLDPELGRRWVKRGALATLAAHVPLLWIWTDAVDVPLGLDVQFVTRQRQIGAVVASAVLVAALMVLMGILSYVHRRRTDPFRTLTRPDGHDSA